MKATTGFSMSLGGGNKPKPTAATKPGSKSRLAQHDESDDETCDDGRVELVQAFDQSNGAIRVGGDERGRGEGGGGGPLVIPALKNRDWREESLKRKRGGMWMPPEARAVGGDAGDSSETVGGNTGQAGQAGYGLQVMTREEKMGEEEQQEEEGVMVKGGGDVTMTDGDENGEPKTEDQLALEALISGDSKEKKSTLVLALQSNSLDWREARAKVTTQSETDAYRADLAQRPDVPDLAAYEAVPVEEFGAALLRGMGWKEGMELGARGKKAGEKGAKPKAVERRPALLGLGAKTQAEAMGMELGGWGKGDKAILGAKGGKGWVDKTYVPVVLRNKVTGQIIDSLPQTGIKGGTTQEERTRGREMEIRGESRKERGDGEDTDGSEKRRRRKDYDRDGGRDRRREYDTHNGTQTDRKSSRWEKDREYDQVRRDRCREKERERGIDMDRDRDRGDRDWRDRDRDKERDRDRDKERDRDREKRKDNGRDRDRAPDYNKERERDRRRDRVDDYDKRRRSSRSRERW